LLAFLVSGYEMAVLRGGISMLEGNVIVLGLSTKVGGDVVAVKLGVIVNLSIGCRPVYGLIYIADSERATVGEGVCVITRLCGCIRNSFSD
jgi:hypothetical protein